MPKEKLLELVNLCTMKKCAEFLSESEEIIKRYPKSPRVLNVVGVANSALGKYEIAIDIYLKALKISPENSEVYNNLGNALRRKGDPDAAIKTIRRRSKFNLAMQ